MRGKLQACTREVGSLAGQRAELIYRVIYGIAGRSGAKVPPPCKLGLEAFSQSIALVGEGEDLAKTQREGVASVCPSTVSTQLPWSIGVGKCQAPECLGPCKRRSGFKVSDRRGSEILPRFF